jgi:hypothetical protein
MDNEILSILSKVSSTYNLSTVHLGAVATDEEIRMYSQRVQKTRTFEKEMEELGESVSEQAQSLKDLTEQLIQCDQRETEAFEAFHAARQSSDRTNLVDLELAYTESKNERKNVANEMNKVQAAIEKLNKRLSYLEAKCVDAREGMITIETAQSERISRLTKFFGQMKFVSNPEQFVPSFINEIESNTNAQYVEQRLQLTKHLELSSVPPNGERVATAPITKRSFRYYRQQKDSTVSPHPCPSTKSFSHERINKAYSFLTTGGLMFHSEIRRQSEFYKASNLPGAVIVIVDDKNEEYHARHVFFDFDKKGNLMVLDDGIMFTKNGVTEVGKNDCAVFLTDAHAPHEQLSTVAAIRAMVELLKPETMIDGGDTGDYASVSHHIEGKLLEREGLRLVDDLTAVKRFLNAVGANECIKNKIVLDSNHAEWVSQFISRNPALDGLLDWATLAEKPYKGWSFIVRKPGAVQAYKFGDLTLRHGDRDSLSQGIDTWYKFLCGHYHRTETYLRGGMIGPVAALGPKYLSNGVTAWQNAFATITRFQGVSSFRVVNVMYDKADKNSKGGDNTQHARFAFRGGIYEVPPHRYSKEDLESARVSIC